jgi:hypothetical protein
MGGPPGLFAAAALGLLLALPAEADDAALTAEQIIAAVYEANGGEAWRRPQTLYLEGYGIFWPDGTANSRVVADHYRMWREFAPASADAHLANGKVRIDSFVGDGTMFQIAFDGETAYNADGPIPGGAASPQWKNSFGFGIIRYALDDGFALERLPDDTVEGHPAFFVRVSDPAGSQTLFGIDKRDYAVRMVGFETPKGWHHRLYSDFVTGDDPAWRQPRLVRLYYDGVKQNEIHWQVFRVNEPVADEVFVLPAED